MKHTIQEENLRKKLEKETKNASEFLGFARVVHREAVDELFASQLQSILEQVEGMKKEEPSDCICKQTNDRSLCAWHQLYKNYNRALSDVQSIISNRMENKI